MENIFLLEGILSEAWSSIKNGGGSVFLRSAFFQIWKSEGKCLSRYIVIFIYCQTNPIFILYVNRLVK